MGSPVRPTVTRSIAGEFRETAVGDPQAIECGLRALQTAEATEALPVEGRNFRPQWLGDALEA